MGLRKIRPLTPGQRHLVRPDFSEITKHQPERRLLEKLPNTGGRNVHGRRTSRFMGAWGRRLYRQIDFKRDKDNIPARVTAVEYDPNRTARLALLTYRDGEKRYILAPEGLQVGATVISGQKVEPEVGNAMPLASIPLGSIVHNVELRPGEGGTLARSAASFARLSAREKGYAWLVLPSSEVRMVRETCRATLGRVGNLEHQNISLGKAGRKRWLGRRPHNRGTSMNPVDHPMGGGSGRRKGGHHPTSPWGKLSKGGKTRKPKSLSNRYIVRRRKPGPHVGSETYRIG